MNWKKESFSNVPKRERIGGNDKSTIVNIDPGLEPLVGCFFR